MNDEFSPGGATVSNFVPEAAVWQRFQGGSLVLRVHRPDPVLGVLCKQTFSDQYAIHDNDMI
jgi:hypothetical protein